MHRRRFLTTAAAGGVSAFAGCSEEGGRPTATETPGRTGTATAGAGQPPQDFVWAEQPIWRDERVRENLFAFAGRHGLAAVIAKADADASDVPALEAALDAASRHGVEAWLNIGVLKRLTATDFVDNGTKRRQHLTGLEAVAEMYGESVPDGRIVLWQEAPVAGAWIEGGAWNDAAVSNLERFGPEIFAAQKRRIARVAPDVDVGIFVHFPYLVESREPETFAGLMADLEARNALPEFTFTDFYRGWYEKDVGPEAANAAIGSLIENARRHTGGRPVFYLGESHTIDPGYTPSRQSMTMDLRASLGAGAAGVGWYARTVYTETTRGFDPFVPNVGPAARNGPRASTLTFARDRYQYAYAALRAARKNRARRNSGERFDLWLCGRAFDFYDHRLSLRNRAGERTFVGDFSGYVDGEYPHGNGGTAVSVFRALPRARFESNGNLTLTIETHPRSDGAGLESVLAMPADVGTYLTESRAATVYEKTSNIEAFGMGYEHVDDRLQPGRSRSVTVRLEEARRPFEMLVQPGQRTQRERLRTLESRARFDPSTKIDLWVYAADGFEPGGLSLVGDDRTRALDAVSVAVSTATRGAVYHGIDRAHLPHDDGTVRVELAGETAFDGAYAMPYFGSVTFVPAFEAVSLMEADRERVRTFSVATVER